MVTGMHAKVHNVLIRASLGLTLLARSPESQVVAKQLHDECGILVRVLSHIVELGNSIFESSAGHLACFIGVAEYFVLEYGEVEGEAEANGMSHGQVLLRNLLRLFVCYLGAVCCSGLLVTIGKVSNVTEVVGLHLLVEDLRLAVARFWD